MRVTALLILVVFLALVWNISWIFWTALVLIALWWAVSKGAKPAPAKAPAEAPAAAPAKPQVMVVQRGGGGFLDIMLGTLMAETVKKKQAEKEKK